MIIERTENEVIIRLPASVNTEDLNELFDYLRFKEIASKSNAKKSDINKLIESVKSRFRKKNKKNLLINENNH